MLLGVLTGWLERRAGDDCLPDRRKPSPAAPAWHPAAAPNGRDRRRLAVHALASGPRGPPGDRHDCDARHAAAVASPAECAEMDVRSAPRPVQRPPRDPALGRADGGGECDVGLHTDPIGPEQRGAPRRRSTIRRILKAADLPPVPQRPTSWQTFLEAHWDSIAGADFFTTEVRTAGLVTTPSSSLISRPAACRSESIWPQVVTNRDATVRCPRGRIATERRDFDHPPSRSPGK